jgi:hypothetical protein
MPCLRNAPIHGCQELHLHQLSPHLATHPTLITASMVASKNGTSAGCAVLHASTSLPYQELLLSRFQAKLNLLGCVVVRVPPVCGCSNCVSAATVWVAVTVWVAMNVWVAVMTVWVAVNVWVLGPHGGRS